MIGVTLASVAVGNLLGGRLADRRPRALLLAGLFAAAALFTAAVPHVVPVLASRYLPEGLGLDVSFGLLGRASLLVALVALGPPLVLLGAATPFLVRGATRDGRVGRAAGLVSGTATLGSLVGTWGPVHWLVPTIGSAWTCAVAAGAVLTAGVVTWSSARPRSGSAGGVLAVALLGVGSLGLSAGREVGHPVPAGVEVLAELETRYQYARVERHRSRTILRLNEGLDSYHSMTVDGELLTGAYFDQYGLFVPRSSPDEVIDVVVLGHAAGTIARQILALDPAGTVRVTGVELDPDVAALGPLHFGLDADDERLRVVTGQDARVFLDRTAERFDLIVVDTYADQVYVPFQTCSLEFFESAYARLEVGGVLAANLSGFTVQDAPVAAIRDTAARVFGEVALLRVTGGRNFVLVAAREAPPPEPWASATDDSLHPLALLAAAARLPGAWMRFRDAPEHFVLTDDRSPIEKLADAHLMELSRRQLEELR